MEIRRRENDFFVYDDEEGYVTTISIASWDKFEKTISSLAKKYVWEIAQHLAENQSDDYLDLIPFAYLWTLQTGDKESISLYETSVLPRVTHHIPIQQGRRWTVAYDTHLKAGKRYEIIVNWLQEVLPVTYLERRERWVAIHSLFIVSGEMEPKIQEKIYSLYMDFLKDGQNRDVEEFFGNTIEADFIKLYKEWSKGKRIEDKMGWFLKNWLMRRYSVKEASGRRGLTFFIFLGGVILMYAAIFIGALVVGKNSFPFLYHSPGLTLWKIGSLVGFSLLLGGWGFVGKYLSRLIWGSVIGWILFFSGALTDVIHSKYEGTPQILQLNRAETLFSVLVFLAIVLFIVYQEVKEAHIEGRLRRLIRAGGVVLIGLYFSLVIGAILTSVVSWYFPTVECWFNRWYLIILAVGAPQALTVGVITQLIWESRRITEMVRK